VIRRLYRQEDSVSVDSVLVDALTLTGKEMGWKNLDWKIMPRNGITRPAGRACETLRLVVVSLLLSFAEGISSDDEKRRTGEISFEEKEETFHIQFRLDESISLDFFHLEMVRCLLASCAGEVFLEKDVSSTFAEIRLPLEESA